MGCCAGLHGEVRANEAWRSTTSESKAQNPPPQRPGLFRQGESKGLLPGSQSARLTEQSRLSLPPIPKTSRSYEETEEEKARREHQRMLATYNRVQRRGFNPLSREPPVSVL